MREWLDRGKYQDYVEQGEADEVFILGYTEVRVGYIRTFVRRVDHTWDVHDHATMERAREYVEQLAESHTRWVKI